MDKEIILEDVRSLNKENQLMDTMINMLLRPHEIDAVRNAAVYSDDKQ